MTRRSESGYSKDRSKAFGPSTLNFQLDFSDHDKSIRKARADTQRLSKEIRSVEKFINAQGGRSQYGEVRIMKGDLNMFAEQISRRLLPAGTVEMQVEAKKAMTPFAREVTQLMKGFVNRIDTGTMNREVRYRIESTGAVKRINIRVGWVRLWYKYFDYQEYGTQYIPPMKALFNTRLRGEKMFDDRVRKFYRDYILKSGKASY
jgi:hypothetical protein